LPKKSKIKHPKSNIVNFPSFPMPFPNRFLPFAALAVLAIVALGIAWHFGWIQQAISLKDPLLEWCRVHPVALFLAIAILPSFAFPASPLLILAGVVWGSNPLACAISLAAVLINITWSHWLSAGVGRKIIQRLLGDHWEKWKSKSGSHDWRLAVALRLTPGVPLCAQNYLLGLLGMPLRYSLAVALPTSGLYVFGFVLTGGAIFEGKTGLLIFGFSLLVIACFVLKVIVLNIVNHRQLQPARQN
jgi:uncharacterized membrane protein YdjX (TVP38/TMEM64 family)